VVTQATSVTDEILAVFAARGAQAYFGEPVSIVEHCQQAAHFARAEGATLWDVDGNSYVDFMCAYGPMVLGYGNREVEEAAAAQRALGDVLTEVWGFGAARRVIWLGFACQVVSGFTLWSSKPDRYLADAMFDTKFSFVILGAVLTVYFQNVLKREAAGWQAAGAVSSRGIQLVCLTSVAWAAVLTTGRLTAYLSTLYMR
jgi:hypothetical protein